MKELTLEITSKCQLKCPWCSSEASPKGEHVDLGRVVSRLREYRESCNVVRLSGGEPTLHPRLHEIVGESKRLNYQVVLLTNGLERYLHRLIDEYVVHIVSDEGLKFLRVLRNANYLVSGQVVLVRGNEFWVGEGIERCLALDIPIKLTVLQKQGRGIGCEPLELVSWTGIHGCLKENKITITHDDRVITCSALKEGECSLKP